MRQAEGNSGQEEIPGKLGHIKRTHIVTPLYSAPVQSNRGVLQVPQGDPPQGGQRARLVPTVLPLHEEGAAVPPVPTVPQHLHALVDFLAYDPAGKTFGLVARLREGRVQFADGETRAELAARCDAHTPVQQPQVQGHPGMVVACRWLPVANEYELEKVTNSTNNAEQLAAQHVEIEQNALRLNGVVRIMRPECV